MRLAHSYCMQCFHQPQILLSTVQCHNREFHLKDQCHLISNVIKIIQIINTIINTIKITRTKADLCFTKMEDLLKINEAYNL